MGKSAAIAETLAGKGFQPINITKSNFFPSVKFAGERRKSNDEQPVFINSANPGGNDSHTKTFFG
jgi:hypothetical protein